MEESEQEVRPKKARKVAKRKKSSSLQLDEESLEELGGPDMSEGEAVDLESDIEQEKQSSKRQSSHPQSKSSLKPPSSMHKQSSRFKKVQEESKDSVTPVSEDQASEMSQEKSVKDIQVNSPSSASDSGPRGISDSEDDLKSLSVYSDHSVAGRAGGAGDGDRPPVFNVDMTKYSTKNETQKEITKHLAKLEKLLETKINTDVKKARNETRRVQEALEKTQKYAK